MIKVGIDLSTTNIGVVVMDSEKLIGNFTVELPKFTFQIQQNKQIHRLLIRMVNDIKKIVDNETVSFFIEVANFTNNGTLGVKFGRYLGIIETYILCAFKWEKVKEIKCFNANEWFTLLMNDKWFTKEKKQEILGERWNIPINQLTRTERKKVSTKMCMLPDDNQADAYWIAYFGSKCKKMF